MGNRRVLLNNTIMMYILSIAKLVIPLISLLYLTSVLSVGCYGSVSFVKSIITFLQVLVDFGFLLSGTKDLIATLNNKQETNRKIGNNFYAQLMLCGVSLLIMVAMALFLPQLNGFEMFAILSVVPVMLSICLFEYVFKAYEQMGKIAIRYVVMRIIALVLTCIFVRGNSDVLLIPIFDIVASLIAIVLVFIQIKKMGLKVDFSFKKIKDACSCLKDSFVYFISNAATTAFTALNTFIIGIMLSEEDVAYWAFAMQLVGVVQALYAPIINSVFPTMVKEKNLNLIHKIMLIYMPLIFVGCGMILLLGDWAVTLVKSEYLMSSTILKYLIPMLIVSFPAVLYGWPCLGAIDKQKETSISTIVSAIVQVLGLVLLILINQFTLLNICIVRCITETVLCSIRMTIVYKNKKLFVKVGENVKENV